MTKEEILAGILAVEETVEIFKIALTSNNIKDLDAIIKLIYKYDINEAESILDLQKEAFNAGRKCSLMTNYEVIYKYKIFEDYLEDMK